MTFTPEQNTALAAKLERDAIKQRSQAGRTFSYVEGWHAISEANRIFGFDGWSRETVVLAQTSEPYKNEKDNWCIGYRCMVRITAGGVMREGSGFGSGIDRDLGRAHESALKEAETDAMKRALMTFGNPFGLALYDKDQEGVEAAPEPARKPSARPEPSPPQREPTTLRHRPPPDTDAAIREQDEREARAKAIKVASDTNVTSGVQPPTADERAATKLILELSSCATESDFLDVKGSEAFRRGRMALGEEQRKRLDETGKRLAARFAPVNPIAGG